MRAPCRARARLAAGAMVDRSNRSDRLSSQADLVNRLVADYSLQPPFAPWAVASTFLNPCT